MPIHVVNEYPAPSRPLRRLAGALVWLLGALLILTGVLATVLPIVYLLLIIATLAIDPGAVRDMAPKPGIVILVVVAVASLSLGLWLVRGRRRLVLFLRRFGFTEATQAVTFALVKALGGSWRLVTLDDAEVSPVGSSKGLRWLSVAVGLVAVAVIAGALFWLFGGGFNALFDKMEGQVMHGATLADILARFLVGIFAVPVLLMVGVLFVIVIPAVFALGVAVFAWSSYGAIRRAERAKTVQITDEVQIEQAASAVVRRSRGIVGPALAVARVASSIWQPVVSRLASVSSAVLIDISAPTDNLIWEIEKLRSGMRARWILVGEQEHLRRMTAGEKQSAPEAKLLRVLDGEQVLAYSSDKRELPRFARSLRAKLETLPS